MEKAKTDFIRAELAVKRAQDKSGLISLDAQTQSTIGAAAQVRGQIVAREVQVQAIRPFSGPENPEMKRLLSELASLRAQLAKIEGGGEEMPAGAGRDSAESLGNVRIFRELKYQEAIYTAMLQQFQLAKADEARDAPLIQQVDVGLPPDRKSKPKRSIIVLVALMIGLILGLTVALWRRAAHRASQDQNSVGRWLALRRAWSLSRNSER
jgi:tyrosine-protein kinase Etk/Wzc